MKAICIGGLLDKTVVEVESPPKDYRLEHIGYHGQPIINFYIAEDMTTSAAFHTVFAAYAKGKGK
jgi:hypothetical protein